MSTFGLEVCPICVKKVDDDDEGLQCDNPCDRWFHRQCTGVPKSDYAKISGDNSVKWYCSRADCVPKSTTTDFSSILNKLVNKVEDLALMVGKLKDVPEDTKTIKSEIHDIKQKLNLIEPKLDELDKRLTILEEKDRNTNQSYVDDVLAELHERASRKKNIIVFNAPESPINQTQAARTYEADLVSAIVNSALPGFDVAGIKFFRLGSRKADKERPIKLVFSNELDMSQIIGNFSAENLSSDFPNLKNVKLSRDRSPLELAGLKQLRIELDTRKQAGEEDLTIKYRNGVPKIVKLISLQKN